METIKSYLDKKAISCRNDTIITTRRVLEKLDKFKPLSKITENDLVKFFNKFDGANSSKNLYIVTIKKFFKDQGKKDIVEFLKPVKLDNNLKENEILTTSDINKLLAVDGNHYFQALIAFLYESGCRIGEAHALRYKDLTLTTDGYIVEIQSHKTSGKSRKLILPFSTRYITNLKLASFAKDDDFIFNFEKGYERVRLTEMGKLAKIGKPVHPHAFRHASATQDSRNQYTEQQLKKKFGWAHGSKMADRYTHLTDDDIQNKMMEVAGKKESVKLTQEKIVEAVPLKLYEAANRLFELEDLSKSQQETLDKQQEIIQVMEHEHINDIRTLTEEIEQMKEQQTAIFKYMRKVEQ